MGSVVLLKARKGARQDFDQVARLVGSAGMAARFDEVAEQLKRVTSALEKMSAEIKARRERYPS